MEKFALVYPIGIVIAAPKGIFNANILATGPLDNGIVVFIVPLLTRDVPTSTSVVPLIEPISYHEYHEVGYINEIGGEGIEKTDNKLISLGCGTIGLPGLKGLFLNG